MNGTVVHAIQGDTVDALVWRHYGRTAGLVEMVLNANPGLSAHGPVLPMGTPVLLPPPPPAPTRSIINIWE